VLNRVSRNGLSAYIETEVEIAQKRQAQGQEGRGESVKANGGQTKEIQKDEGREAGQGEWKSEKRKQGC
jgi:hypothetical protein